MPSCKRMNKEKDSGKFYIWIPKTDKQKNPNTEKANGCIFKFQLEVLHQWKVKKQANKQNKQKCLITN